MDTLSKAFVLILAVLLLYIYPLSDSAAREDDLSRVIAFETMTRFVDNVRDKGRLTPAMYEQFQKELTTSGQEFDVNMEHKHKRYVPVYDDQGRFAEKYTVEDEAFYNAQILSVLFPENSLPPDRADRTYKLGAGDYFTVTVRSLSRTPAVVWQDALNGTNTPGGQLYMPYGGMVRNEDS
ncbi:hypothetical protein [Paenibacillus chitinolyticus]|uniref:hypothetical protein n=1 Tax=Paenibacillus chitinolyticus TaxID=79263 RepID=UPI00366D4F55